MLREGTVVELYEENRIAELKQELRDKCGKCDFILQQFIEVTQCNVRQFLLAKLRADVGFSCRQAAETVNPEIVRNTEQLYQLAWNMAMGVKVGSIMHAMILYICTTLNEYINIGFARRISIAMKLVANYFFGANKI